MSIHRQNSEGRYIYLWMDNARIDSLTRIALAEKQSLPVIISRFIDLGMGKSDHAEEEGTSRLIREAVNDVIQPQINRLAKISSRVSSIDAATFFLLAHIGRIVLPPDDRQDVDVVAGNAQQLGIEYAKSRKDFDMDEFIRKGIEQLKNTSSEEETSL